MKCLTRLRRERFVQIKPNYLLRAALIPATKAQAKIVLLNFEIQASDERTPREQETHMRMTSKKISDARVDFFSNEKRQHKG